MDEREEKGPPPSNGYIQNPKNNSASPAEPPPYETILEIPDWRSVPPPPAYHQPKVMGADNYQDFASDAAYPPPPYEEHMPQQSSLPRLAYADFLPKCICPGDSIQPAQFDNMKTLMTVVNQWLSSNTQYTVIRCESIERIVGENGHVETETTIRFQGTFTLCHYVRGIRLWMKPNTNQAPVQQLWYMNVVPQVTPIRVPMSISFGGPMGFGHTCTRMHMFHHGMLFPSFENLDKVLEKLNKKLQSEPIPGKILTIESIDTKYGEGFNWKCMSPDECSWSEKGGTSKMYLTVLRIFFVIGHPEQAEIDIVDFAPMCVDKTTSAISTPRFQPLSGAISRAHDWIIQQHDKRITNIQTVTTKLLNSALLGQPRYDTKDMDFSMASMADSTFIKVIRVPFVKTSCTTNPQLTSQTFVPVRYGGKKSETMSQTLYRVNQWINSTGVNVFGVDTIEYEFSTSTKYPINTEESRSTVLHVGHHWMTTIRLYIDGAYSEPPPEVFAPIPAYVDTNNSTQSSECCAIL